MLPSELLGTLCRPLACTRISLTGVKIANLTHLLRAPQGYTGLRLELEPGFAAQYPN